MATDLGRFGVRVGTVTKPALNVRGRRKLATQIDPDAASGVAPDRPRRK